MLSQAQTLGQNWAGIIFCAVTSLLDGCYWCYNNLFVKDKKWVLIKSAGIRNPTANITHATPYAEHPLPKEIFSPGQGLTFSSCRADPHAPSHSNKGDNEGNFFLRLSAISVVVFGQKLLDMPVTMRRYARKQT